MCIVFVPGCLNEARNCVFKKSTQLRIYHIEGVASKVSHCPVSSDNKITQLT